MPLKEAPSPVPLAGQVHVLQHLADIGHRAEPRHPQHAVLFGISSPDRRRAGTLAAGGNKFTRNLVQENVIGGKARLDHNVEDVAAEVTHQMLTESKGGLCGVPNGIVICAALVEGVPRPRLPKCIARTAHARRIETSGGKAGSACRVDDEICVGDRSGEGGEIPVAQCPGGEAGAKTRIK